MICSEEEQRNINLLDLRQQGNVSEAHQMLADSHENAHKHETSGYLVYAKHDLISL